MSLDKFSKVCCCRRLLGYDYVCTGPGPYNTCFCVWAALITGFAAAMVIMVAALMEPTAAAQTAPGKTGLGRGGNSKRRTDTLHQVKCAHHADIHRVPLHFDDNDIYNIALRSIP